MSTGKSRSDGSGGLPTLGIPDFLNYVGVFLTIDCNLGCTYCINDPEQAGQRNQLFRREESALTPEQWVLGLARIPVREDLPLTLQGGEPTIYERARGLGRILAGIGHRCDLLTNMVLSPEAFARCIDGAVHSLQRDAPYPSIRVSWHPDEMQRRWGERAFNTLVQHCLALRNLGFRVTADKATSDVGIYMVAVPGHENTREMQRIAEGRVPFEIKEFLGSHEGELHGTYRYPFSTDLVSSGAHDTTLQAECRTSELLLDPMGFAWPCHSYLYETWKHGGPRRAFRQLAAGAFQFQRLAREIPFDGFQPVGHILDPEFRIEHVNAFHPCGHYGKCIGCDTKIKNNRFQSLDDAGEPHTSVEIRDIRFPAPVLALIDEPHREIPAPPQTTEVAR